MDRLKAQYDAELQALRESVEEATKASARSRRRGSEGDIRRGCRWG